MKHHALIIFAEDESYNFHPYAKKAPTEVHVEVLTTERGDSSQSFDFDDDEDDFSRERRRPGGYVLSV